MEQDTASDTPDAGQANIPETKLEDNVIPADGRGMTLDQIFQELPDDLMIDLDELEDADAEENQDNPINLSDFGIPSGEENFGNQLLLEAHHGIPALGENLAAEMPPKCGACEYGKRTCNKLCKFKDFVPVEKYAEYGVAAKTYTKKNLTEWLKEIPGDKRGEYMENRMEEAQHLKSDRLGGSAKIIKEKDLRIKELEEQNKQKDALIQFLQNGGSNPTAHQLPHQPQQPQHQQFPPQRVPYLYPQNQQTQQVPYTYPTRHQLSHQPQQPQQQSQQQVPYVDPQYLNPTQHQYLRQVPYPYLHYPNPTHNQFTYRPQQPHLSPQQQPQQNPYTTAPCGPPPHRFPYQPQQPHLFPQQQPHYTTAPDRAPPHQFPYQPQQPHLFPPQQPHYTTAPDRAPPQI